MAGGSVDGRVSGLDTTPIISQLMSLERQPQNRPKTLKTSLSNEIFALATARTASAATAAPNVPRFLDTRA